MRLQPPSVPLTSCLPALARRVLVQESVLQEAMDAFREDFGNAQRQVWGCVSLLGLQRQLSTRQLSAETALIHAALKHSPLMLA